MEANFLTRNYSISFLLDYLYHSLATASLLLTLYEGRIRNLDSSITKSGILFGLKSVSVLVSFFYISRIYTIKFVKFSAST